MNSPSHLSTADSLPRRKLGAGGMEVSAIGLGCWGMSGAYGAADAKEAEGTLRLALERGVNFFDTADSYGDGENEKLVGRVLKSHRQQIVLATKAGFVKRTDAAGNRTTTVDGSPKHIREACEASLARLGTDYIDLYYLHRVDPMTPIEDSVGALSQLVAAGKVRFIGLSEVSAATLRRAHAVHPIAAVQSEYSLWTRDVEAEVLPACRALNISLVAFSPLGRGFLTGQARREDFTASDFRAKNPRFAADNFERNRSLLEKLRAMADSRGVETSQIALAWLLAQREVVPIPGTKRRRHLEQNLAAGSIELTADEVAQLHAAFPPNIAAGARYQSELDRWIDR